MTILLAQVSILPNLIYSTSLIMDKDNDEKGTSYNDTLDKFEVEEPTGAASDSIFTYDVVPNVWQFIFPKVSV